MMHRTCGLLSSTLSRGGNLVNAASSSEACTYIQRRQLSYLAYARRQKIRRQWASKDAWTERPEAGLWDSYPRERLGRHYALNWALHKYKIAPEEEAFRNLHLGGLLMYAKGTADSKKALHVQLTEEQENFAVYYGEKASSYSKDAKVLNIDTYKLLVKQIKDHLSNVPALFVHDGVIGSHAHSEIKVRAITDDAVPALYLHHALPKAVLSEVASFAHNLTIYVTPSFRVKKESGINLPESSYVILDIPRGIAFVVGTPSTRAVQSALVSLASPRFLVDKELAPLQADIVEISQGRPLLVVSPGNALQKRGVKLNFASSGNASWGPKGLYRFFESKTSPFNNELSLSRGDIVEDVVGKDGKVKPIRATTKRTAIFNSHPHPSAVVVAVEDASGTLPAVSKVSAAGIKSLFLAGPTGNKDRPFSPLFGDSLAADPSAVADKLASIANAENVGVYLVNLTPKGGDLTNDDVTQIFTSISEGNATAAAALPNVFSNLSPITSLNGVTRNIDPTKGQQLDAIKKSAATFDSALNSYITTNYPTLQQTPPPQK